MLIGEVVRRTGLTKDAIRFYERKGLISVERSKTPYNNYKTYTAQNLDRLFGIKSFKAAGFTIKEISLLFNMIEENKASCKNTVDLVKNKIREIDDKIRDLKRLKKQLKDGIGNVDEKCTPEVFDKNCPSVVLKMKQFSSPEP